MSKALHQVYVWSMVAITLAVTAYLIYTGYTYYRLPLEERFYHPHYDWFKPSGLFGQGLGVVGTLMIAFGVGIYIARKRYGFLARFIRLKYLLEFHIFLCILGPILILFHTTFKFGGIVSVAFWSMVAVVLSGVVGRFIYIRIPRAVGGQELSMQEIQDRREGLLAQLAEQGGEQSKAVLALLDGHSSAGGRLGGTMRNWKILGAVKRILKTTRLTANQRREILALVKEELALRNSVARLEQMKKLFQYWHVVHMPFALIMLIIVLIHVIVTVSLGYRWIF